MELITGVLPVVGIAWGLFAAYMLVDGWLHLRRATRAAEDIAEALRAGAPVGAFPGRAPVGRREEAFGEWHCEGCGSIQSKEDDLCLTCGRSRPADLADRSSAVDLPAGLWTCPRCDAVNAEADGACSSCGARRPSS